MLYYISNLFLFSCFIGDDSSKRKKPPQKRGYKTELQLPGRFTAIVHKDKVELNTKFMSEF